MGIEYHHIHHLISKIPGYNLKKCYDENKYFHKVNRLTLTDCYNNLWLNLYDDKNKKFISCYDIK